MAHTSLPAEIFKAYDIRGIVEKNLTPPIVYAIGQALGSLAREQQQTAIAVGRDGRLSGPILADALIEGITHSGINAIDIGCVPTPVTYFAAHELQCHSCISVTGSHNPPEYNGLKMVIAGNTLAGTDIQALKTRIEKGQLSTGNGQRQQADVQDAYRQRILNDIHLSRPMKIAIDCGNGVAGKLAPQLFKGLGCNVTERFCTVDGHFPNHHPDPSKPENLQDLINTLRNSDIELGLAFDGDGDRLGVVTHDGQIIYPDRQLMLFAADILQRHPDSEIIYDVKCTRLLDRFIRQHGGRPLMWKTGHALIKQKLKQSQAPLAGEMSGHLFFKERWYGFDDALYAGARLLEILSRHDNPSATLHALPNSTSTPEINIPMNGDEPFTLLAELKTHARFTRPLNIITLDGLRVEYADGFGLIRPSNTTPVMVLRFEADNPEALQRIQNDFRNILKKQRPTLALPF